MAVGKCVNGWYVKRTHTNDERRKLKIGFDFTINLTKLPIAAARINRGSKYVQEGDSQPALRKSRYGPQFTYISAIM